MAYKIRKKSSPEPQGQPSPPTPAPGMSRGTFPSIPPGKSAWAFVLVIFLVILTGTGIVYHIHSNKKKAEASGAALETNAEQLYSRGERNNGPQLAQAKAMFEDVMKKYKDTSSSRIAPLFLASIENIQNPKDSGKAMAWLHLGMDRNAGNMKLLPFYYESMGVTLMSAHQYEQALAMFQKVIAFPEKILADAALYNIGKIYQDLNQPALAIINYKKLVAEFPSSPWAAESQPFLMKNGISAPTTAAPMAAPPK